MSQHLQDLVDALAILRGTRLRVNPSDRFQWDKLYSADRHLEKQLKAYFEEEAAA